jgi:hypothetical protein
MSDEVETAVSVLHLLSGRYAEVHISQEIIIEIYKVAGHFRTQ